MLGLGAQAFWPEFVNHNGLRTCISAFQNVVEPVGSSGITRQHSTPVIKNKNRQHALHKFLQSSPHGNVRLQENLVCIACVRTDSTFDMNVS